MKKNAADLLVPLIAVIVLALFGFFGDDCQMSVQDSLRTTSQALQGYPRPPPSQPAAPKHLWRWW